jgi:ribosome-binding protein aMBF1 (putative translation factor)
MSPEQVRAARGWLGWSQSDLAKRASVGLSTLKDFENGNRTPIANNLNAIQRALEAAGIELVFDGSTAVGIRKNGSVDGSA